MYGRMGWDGLDGWLSKVEGILSAPSVPIIVLDQKRARDKILLLRISKILIETGKIIVQCQQALCRHIQQPESHQLSLNNMSELVGDKAKQAMIKSGSPTHLLIEVTFFN